MSSHDSYNIAAYDSILGGESFSRFRANPRTRLHSAPPGSEATTFFSVMETEGNKFSLYRQTVHPIAHSVKEPRVVLTSLLQ